MPPTSPTSIQACEATLYVSLELSHSTWLVTALSSGGTKMSKYCIAGR